MNTGSTIKQHEEEEPEKVSPGVEVVDFAEKRAKLEDEVTHEDGPVGEEMQEVEAFCLAIEGEIKPDKRDALKREIIERLERAKGAENRVDLFSKLADWCGLEAIIGLVVPEVGDLATSTAEVAYLLGEANYAGMEYSGQAKILAYQLVDLAIGLVPVVGDVGDFFFMGNRMSAGEFKKHTEKLAAEAIEAGVPEGKVQEILASGERLRQVTGVADSVVSATRLTKGGGGEDAAA